MIAFALIVLLGVGAAKVRDRYGSRAEGQFIIAVLLALAVIGLTACGGGDPAPAPVATPHPSMPVPVREVRP